jgi:hypothetical protein
MLATQRAHSDRTADQHERDRELPAMQTDAGQRRARAEPELNREPHAAAGSGRFSSVDAQCTQRRQCEHRSH